MKMKNQPYHWLIVHWLIDPTQAGRLTNDRMKWKWIGMYVFNGCNPFKYNWNI